MSSSGSTRKPHGHVSAEDLDAVLGACRLLVAISVRSMAQAGDEVGATQLRALVVVASRGSLSLGALAEAVGISLSTASRMCDRMVESGLLNRADDPTDRRQVVLTLTADGQTVVQKVMRERKEALTAVLSRLSKTERSRLTTALPRFVEAGGEPEERELWALGWTT